MCEYCNGNKKLSAEFAPASMTAHLDVAGMATVEVEVQQGRDPQEFYDFEIEFEINYCPMCGQNLKEA